MTPLVTVVLPVYNAAGTVAQALDSVLWQGYARLDIIVVDDGSTDDTLKVLAPYSQAIRVLHQVNQGPAAARNLALQHALGEYIAFIDADDVWLPGKLHVQVAYLTWHSEIDAVFGRFKRWEADPLTGLFEPPPPQGDYLDATMAVEQGDQAAQLVTTALRGNLYADLLLESVVHIITALVRRSAVKAINGFDAGLVTGSDYDFWLRLSLEHRMDQLDLLTAWYRIHPASITKRPVPQNAEYAILVRTLANHGATGPDGRMVPAESLKRRLFNIAFGHGYLHFWLGHLTFARKAFAQALTHDFWRPKAWVYWLLTFIWRQPNEGLGTKKDQKTGLA